MLDENTTLNIGDEVMVRTGYSHDNYEIVKVKTVTPTGQIVVVDARGNTTRYDNQGYEMLNKSRDRLRKRSQLELATPEKRALVTRQYNLNVIRSANLDNLSNETLQSIVNIIRQEEQSWHDQKQTPND